MDPERWSDLQELLLRLEGLDVAARRELLDAECGDDPGFRRQVEGMLADLLRPETEDWIGSSIKSLLPQDLNKIPERLGRYRITGEIGRGGLAVVLAAERDDREYSQKVAIKLIRRGLDTADLLLRLRQERQILARLRHPNIAALIDGGSTADGRPFVVMEYIEGQPIDAHCRDLPLRACLELFLVVCESVQYAHQNLVIHRDIKPHNILVTADGRPKLLDFGIAKVLQPDRHDPENFAPTLPGLRLLTPEYASPEQLRGEPLTTATDVYSLGVLLFELLTGERPFGSDSGDHQALETAMRESSPDRPSTRMRERVTAVGPDRRDDLLRRSKAAVGDLDNIVLMALRAEPDRRYGSVEQLADDIRRYLQDMPVRARTDTTGYRVGKFVRRHRLPVSIALLSAMLLITTSLVAVRQAQLANRGRLASEHLSELLVDLFEMPDPGDGSGNTVTAREVLDRGAERTFRGLEDQPELKALFMDTIGRVYNNLGLYDRAEQLFTSSVSLRRHGDDLTLAESLNHLGEAQYHRGSFEEAEEHFQESLELRRRALGADQPELAENLLNLGAVSLMKRDLDSTEALWEKALALRQEHLGDHGDLAEAHDNLGALRELQGRPAEAEVHLRRALDLHRRFHGASHHQTVRTMSNLAALLHRSGDPEESETLYRKALSAQTAILGEDHPQVAKSTSNLAALLVMRGRNEEAEQLLRKALASLQERLGAEHHEVTYPMFHLADVLVRSGEPGYDEAEQLYREVQRIRARSLRPDHPHLVSPWIELARLALERGRLSEAEASARNGFELSLRIHGENHATTSTARDLLRQARELQQAREPQ